MTTENRFPGQRMARVFLESIPADAAAYSAKQIESAQGIVDENERRLSHIESDLESLEDTAIYEVYRSGESNRVQLTKRTISKSTEKFIWLDPDYEGDKIIRLPKEPIVAGEFVRPQKRKWWAPEFGLGGSLRPRLELDAYRAGETLLQSLEELGQMRDAVENGHVAFPLVVRESLLHIEDSLAEGKELPAVDWRRFGF